MRSSTLIQSYQRTRILRRVMVVAFGFMSLGTLLWIVPWVPWGLRPEDYSAGAGVPVALAFGAWVSAFGAVYLRDQSNRYEQTLLTWSSVHDQLGDLRRREYFYERVVIECTRSNRSNVPFGVFAARFGTGEGTEAAEIATALEALGGLVRQTDSLAALGPQEVGVLGAGMGQRESPAFAYRLKSTLETATGAGSHEQVNVGWAIWGTDGVDAGSLIGIAHSRMQHKSAVREFGMAFDAGDEPGIRETDGEEPNESIVDISSHHRRRNEPAA